ncbi:MAG: hypothetical protein KJ896_03425 [Nanoarchaeota archaeon]|nr:hypothetical protein [Nanoarchaeota archaeon]
MKKTMIKTKSDTKSNPVIKKNKTRKMRFKKINKISFFVLTCIVSVILLSLFVIATSKPITGTITFPDETELLEINLFVEVNSPFNGTQICVINPSVNSGSDGSFSTNLNNLVFENFPTARCNSLWQVGDNIWYETIYQSNSFSSEIQNVEPGTGLQILEYLEVSADTSDDGTGPSSSAAAGGGGGGVPGQETDLLTEEELGGIIDDSLQRMSEIEIILSLEEVLSLENFEDYLRAKSLLNLVNNIEKSLTLKLVISELPNNHLIRIISEDVNLAENFRESFEWQEIIDLTEIGDGWYQLQVFVYSTSDDMSNETSDGETLLGVSNTEEFFVRNNLLDDETDIRAEQPSQILSGFIYIVLIILILLEQCQLIFQH